MIRRLVCAVITMVALQAQALTIKCEGVGACSVELTCESAACGPETTCWDVNNLYRELLGRNGDPGGLAYWAGQVDTAVITLAKLRVILSTSPEAQSWAAKKAPAP